MNTDYDEMFERINRGTILKHSLNEQQSEVAFWLIAPHEMRFRMVEILSEEYYGDVRYQNIEGYSFHRDIESFRRG